MLSLLWSVSFAEESTTRVNRLITNSKDNTNETTEPTDTSTVNVLLLGTTSNESVTESPSSKESDIQPRIMSTNSLENITDFISPAPEHATSRTQVSHDRENRTETDILNEITDKNETTKSINSENVWNTTSINSDNLNQTDQSIATAGNSVTESNVQIWSNYSTQTLESDFVTEVANVVVGNITEQHFKGPGSPEDSKSKPWLNSTLQDFSTFSNIAASNVTSAVLDNVSTVEEVTTTTNVVDMTLEASSESTENVTATQGEVTLFRTCAIYGLAQLKTMIPVHNTTSINHWQ